MKKYEHIQQLNLWYLMAVRDAIVLPRVAFGHWQPDSEAWKPRNWNCGEVFQRRSANQVETVCIPWPGMPVRLVARWRSKIEQG